MTNTELKSIRKSLDLSKTDFARAIGISPVMEGKYEKGSREIPENVSQAAIELLNSTELETDSSVDEDAVSVVEEAAPVVDEAPAEEEFSTPEAEEATASPADESSAEEAAPAADADQAAGEISACAVEETAAVCEKSPAEGKKNTAAADASPAESDTDTANWAQAAMPYFLPTMFATSCLLSMGFFLSPKKRPGFFGPWW